MFRKALFSGHPSFFFARSSVMRPPNEHSLPPFASVHVSSLQTSSVFPPRPPDGFGHGGHVLCLSTLPKTLLRKKTPRTRTKVFCPLRRPRFRSLEGGGSLAAEPRASFTRPARTALYGVCRRLRLASAFVSSVSSLSPPFSHVRSTLWSTSIYLSFFHAIHPTSRPPQVKAIWRWPCSRGARPRRPRPVGPAGTPATAPSNGRPASDSPFGSTTPYILHHR